MAATDVALVMFWVQAADHYANFAHTNLYTIKMVLWL